MKLYEVNEAIQSLLLQLEPDPETGEIPMDDDAIIAELNGLQMERSRIEKPQSWDELIAIVNEVSATPNICKTLVIDTADWAEQLAVDHICTKYKQNSIESFGYGVDPNKPAYPNQAQLRPVQAVA